MIKMIIMNNDSISIHNYDQSYDNNVNDTYYFYNSNKIIV